MQRKLSRPLAFTATFLIIGWSLRPALIAPDPVITYSTYIGGTEFNGIFGADIDAEGNIYVVGHTSTPDFPGVVPQGPAGGSFDIFAARIDPEEGVYDWLTLVGGTEREFAADFKLADDGRLFITGRTSSSDFPTVNPALSTYSGGANDGVALILNSDGELLLSTYLGGAGDDRPQSLDIGPDGEFVIGGRTDSPDFPTIRAAQEALASPGEDDGFVYILGESGNVYKSTYYGASDRDRVQIVTVDANSNLWLAGTTRSNDFPMEAPFDDELSGSSSTDGFIAMFADPFSDPDAVFSVGLSSYVGGSGFEGLSGFASDPLGNVFAVGNTGSDDFFTFNPSQPAYGGANDGFYMIFGPDANLITSSYLGLEMDREDLRAVTASGGGCALAAGSAITLGTSDTRAEVHRLCGDTPPENLGPIGSATPNDISLSPDGRQIVLAGSAIRGGITPTATAVQPDPPTEPGDPGDTNDDDGFAIVIESGEPQAALAANLAKSEGLVRIYEPFTLTLEITNVGTAAADGVIAQLSIESSMVLSDPGQGRFLERMGSRVRFQWDVGSLNPGEKWTEVVTTHVTESDIEEVEVFLLADAVNAQGDADLASFHVSASGADLFMLFFGLDGSGKRQIDLLDIYLDSVKVADDIGPGAAVPAQRTMIRRGDPLLEAVDAQDPDNSNPILSIPIDLLIRTESDTTLSDAAGLVLFEIGEDSLGLVLNKELRSTAATGDIDISVANTSLEPIDIVLTSSRAGGQPLLVADDLASETFSEYFGAEADVQTLTVRSGDGSTELGSFEYDLSDLSGEALVAAFGTGSDDPPLLTLGSTGGQIIDGRTVTSSKEAPVLPGAFQIEGNYPNPVSVSTIIRFDLPDAASVYLEVFDLLGRQIMQTAPKDFHSGFGRTVELDASGLPSAPYMYHVVAEGASGRMVRAGIFVVTR